MPNYSDAKLKQVGDLVADVERATELRKPDERGEYRKVQESVVTARRKAEARAGLRRIT